VILRVLEYNVKKQLFDRRDARLASAAAECRSSEIASDRVSLDRSRAVYVQLYL
jgi:hypothetical protein